MKPRIFVVALIPMMFLGVLLMPMLNVAHNASATPTQYASAFLSAYNSTQAHQTISSDDLQSLYWCNSTPPITIGVSPGATILSDVLETELWLHDEGVVRVVTRDFNNPTYPIGLSYATQYAGVQAPSNATILGVYIIAKFTGAYPADPSSAGYVSYSVAATPTWASSFTLASGNLAVNSFGGLQWYTGGVPAYYAVSVSALAANITASESWTPAMLNSENMRVLLRLTIPGSTTYYLDYLGIFYYWAYGAGSSGYYPVGEGPGSFGVPSAMGAIGIIGFVGMIGVPAAGIWFARRSDGSKLAIGIQVMLAFVVCIGQIGRAHV